MTPQLLTVDETASILNCSRRHVVRMIEAGRLKAKDIGVSSEHVWRIYPESIDAVTESPEPIKQPKRKRRKPTNIERFV